MKLRTVLPLILFFFAVQVVLGLFFLRDSPQARLDLAVVNDLVQSASGQWESLQIGNGFVQPDGFSEMGYTIFDASGKVLASNGPGAAANMQEAVARRDTMVDIAADAQTVGKLVFHNDWAWRAQEAHNRRLTVFAAASVMDLAFFASYFFVVNRLLLQPFQKLRSFAVRVAGGDLDFPLTMDRNNVFGAFTESFDLMREELKKARMQEQAANRSKKELVAKLSHDIKTPVASIEAVSELMSVTTQSERERKQLAIIREKANQIDRLISDLFHASLEELQELSVTPLEHSSRLLGELLAAADYQGRAVLEEPPECMLVFDKMRLEQVFDNIFSNSYKYANSPLCVKFAFQSGGLSVSIEDFGPGISDEERPLLFEKFYRGKNAAEKSGAGLGLFISRYLLSQMGGTISCGNTENGFCVTVFLRLAGLPPI